MTDPNNGQRADWFRSNNEAAATSDARYGKDHRPTYRTVGARYAAACTCGCDRAYQPLLHNDWRDALDAAGDSLYGAENGPAS